jgi:DNA-binding NtrC family response regulator
LGLQAISALNGEEGLQKAISDRPDLIITDMNMPKLNGLQLIEKLNEHHLNMPVILFTAHAESEKIQKALQQRQFQHVEKPINLTLLQEIILENLKKQN